MKIELNDDTLQEVSKKISAAAYSLLTEKVGQLEDAALFEEIRSSGATNKEKVVAYLDRTKLNVDNAGLNPRVRIGNAKLANGLGLHVLAMKRVRDELVRERRAAVLRESDRLSLYYFRRPKAQGTPQPTPANT